MANTIVQCDAPDGLTLTLKLYAVNGDTIQNGASGDALTERTNNLGTYTATVTEALTGVHEARITNASDQTIAKYLTEVLVDDTGTYECVERIDVSGIAAAPSAATVAAAVISDLGSGTEVFGHSYLASMKRIEMTAGNATITGAGTGTEVLTSEDSVLTATFTVAQTGDISAIVWA